MGFILKVGLYYCKVTMPSLCRLFSILACCVAYSCRSEQQRLVREKVCVIGAGSNGGGTTIAFIASGDLKWADNEVYTL